MSLELLKTIEQAEAQADSIRQDASRRARELVVEADKRGAEEEARAVTRRRQEAQNILRQAQETSERRIAGLAGGLILLLAVVQPLLRVRWEELTWRYETYQREMDRQTEAYQAAYADSLSGDIADRTAAYISEKAAALGIDCRVQVEVRTEDGLPLPYGASLDVERDQVLSDYMAQELGIPASRQSWQPEE